MFLDLHNQISPEAKVNLQIFLTECKVKRIKKAKISHGYGQNILRNIVYETLNNYPYINKYYPAHPNDGGAGITVVEFDWISHEKY